MADDTADNRVSARDWMLEQVVGDGPALIVSGEHRAGGEDGTEQPAGPVDDPQEQPERDALRQRCDAKSPGRQARELDSPLLDGSSPTAGRDINSGAKRAAVGLGSAVLALTVLIVAAFAVFGGGPEPVAGLHGHAIAPAASAAPTTTTLAVGQQDHAVAFTARTDSCTPVGGSSDQPAARSPQALTDPAGDSAWVCGRGPQESLLDGQILHVQFTCDASRPDSACSYMLNSVSVTPGWIAKIPGGTDEWLQHRVVGRLQFNFFNGNQLVADPFFVDTHAVHGPVPATLPAKVLASRVDVIILHTERPPAAPLPTTTGPGRAPDSTAPLSPDGLTDSLWGPLAAEPAAPPPADPAGGATPSDAIDATFAISQIQFLGHAPT